MLAVLDCDDLVVGHENELAVFSPSEIIFEGNPGLVLDLSTGNLIGIKLDPFLLRLADFDKDVDGMCCNMHWSTSWLSKSVSGPPQRTKKKAATTRSFLKRASRPLVGTTLPLRRLNQKIVSLKKCSWEPTPTRRTFCIAPGGYRLSDECE